MLFGKYRLRLVYILLFILFISCGEENPTINIETGSDVKVEILSPSDGTTISTQDTILLVGNIIQNEEDSETTNNSCIWISDRDGILGHGRSVLACSLSLNKHKIIFNNYLGSCSDSIIIYVIDDCPDYEFVTAPSTDGYPIGGGTKTDPPVLVVSLDAFNIGKYEVNFKLWKSVKVWGEANGYVFTFEGSGGFKSYFPEQNPVVFISWKDAIAWCNAYSENQGLNPVYYYPGAAHIDENVYRNSLKGGDPGNGDCNMNASGYRLPTEAEWEYAARYVDGSVFSPGWEFSGYISRTSDINDFCWYGNNTLRTHITGEKSGNHLGLYDMSGNAAEWCWDWFGDCFSDENLHNPMGPETGYQRIVRGGSWVSEKDACDTSFRDGVDPDIAYYFWGLRLCRSID